MIHVDDLVEPRPEEIVLLTVPPLFRSFGRMKSTSATLAEAKKSQPNAPFNLQEINPTAHTFLQLKTLAETRYAPEDKASPDSSRTTSQKGG